MGRRRAATRHCRLQPLGDRPGPLPGPGGAESSVDGPMPELGGKTRGKTDGFPQRGPAEPEERSLPGAWARGGAARPRPSKAVAVREGTGTWAACNTPRAVGVSGSLPDLGKNNTHRIRGAAVRGVSRVGLQPDTPPAAEPSEKASGLCCGWPPGFAALSQLAQSRHQGEERGPRRLWVWCQSLKIPILAQGGGGECPSWKWCYRK